MDDVSDIAKRLDAIEQRLADLENQENPRPDNTRPLSDDFWALNGLKENRTEDGPDSGSVLFTGSVRLNDGVYDYQWERPLETLTEMDWADPFERLAALAHPVRAAILRRLLSEPASPGTLVDEGVVSSTGAAYHHLGALHAAGWTGKSGDGTHMIRPTRVVALLTIIAAAEDH